MAPTDAAAETRPCIMCLQPASVQCSRCKAAWYCGKNCQKRHWPNHRTDCGAASQASPGHGDGDRSAGLSGAESATEAAAPAGEEQQHEQLRRIAKEARAAGSGHFYYFADGSGAQLRSDAERAGLLGGGDAALSGSSRPDGAVHGFFAALEEAQQERLQAPRQPGVAQDCREEQASEKPPLTAAGAS
eukprot:TRINITY_DN42495_c0_g1_i1.p1 TRINITY_DN42495_c0_g1~~TRINITY_DN42495_c0_g1_i1.p1  ORF type:complete len:188 (-),score=43.06 TRINITY_DN42495_c0_g1_i1:7-570(-)